METGAITNHLDVAQIVLYLFWAFFFALIWYLQKEGKREGYPLLREEGEPKTGFVDYFPPVPAPKTFNLPHGRGTRLAPDMMPNDPRGDVALERVSRNPSDPWEPTGDALADGVGPAAWAQRSDQPDLNVEGHARIVPLSADPEFSLLAADNDPRGATVLGNDRLPAGTIDDVWVDRAEAVIRYLQMKTNAGKTVLIPMNLARITFTEEANTCEVKSLLSTQFDGCPGTKSKTEITLTEEDKIMGYFAGGKFFQTPRSRDPLV